MNIQSLKVILSCLALTWACHLHAQYALDWFAFDGGTSSGEAYALDGTASQPEAGSLSGGRYALEGGFWAAAITVPTLSISRSGTELMLAWTGRGFVVPSADEILGPWQDFSPGVTTDGIHYQVPASITGRRKFFRLRAGQCVDFQTMVATSVSAPWSFLGATFQTFDFASHPNSLLMIRKDYGLTGLDCDHRLTIDLPGPCGSVEVLLVTGSSPATATAYNAAGFVTATATMSVGQRTPETLRLKGSGITRIIIDAPTQETLLLQVCCGS